MKNRIFSACVAALSLAACDEKPVAKVETQPVFKPVVVQSKVAVQAAAAPVGVDGVDSGVVDEKKVDPLAVEHQQPNIDHLARAQTLKSEGDAKGAMLEARRALFTHPEDVDALKLVAQLGQRIGSLELSQQAWQRLGEIDSTDAAVVIQRARVMVTMGRYEDAAKIAQQAIDRDSGNPEGFQALGRAYLSSGQLEGAIAAFQKVIELKPEHGYALNNLGLTYLRANENDKALEVLVKATEVLPRVAYVHNNLGVALTRLGRTDEAKASFSMATTLSPKYVKARINFERVAKANSHAEEEEEQEPETLDDSTSEVDDAGLEVSHPQNKTDDPD